MIRGRLIAMGCLALTLSACGSARGRVGPIGAGLAMTPDGALSGAVSGPSGQPVIAGQIDLPVILNEIVGWLSQRLPALQGSVLSTAPTPVGPQG